MTFLRTFEETHPNKNWPPMEAAKVAVKSHCKL